MYTGNTQQFSRHQPYNQQPQKLGNGTDGAFGVTLSNPKSGIAGGKNNENYNYSGQIHKNSANINTSNGNLSTNPLLNSVARSGNPLSRSLSENQNHKPGFLH